MATAPAASWVLTPGDVATLLPSPPALSSEALGWRDVVVLRQAQPAAELPEWTIGHHKISVVTRGGYCLEQRYSGRWRSARTRVDDVTILPAHAPVSWRWDRPIEVIDLFLAPSTLARVAEQEFDRDPAGVEIRDRFTSREDSLALIARALLSEVAAGDRGRLVAESLATALAVVLIRRHSTSDQPAATAETRRHALSPARLRRAMDFMRMRLADDISLSDVAAEAGLNPQHFARVFRRETGAPPHRYLMGLRVDRARELLIGSDLSLASVAMRSGFCSQSHMTTSFKRVLGTTPGRFRTEARTP